MHHATLLQDLAVVMIVAAIVTVVFRQLRQPVVLGYILAGVIIGPHTPPFPLISDPSTIQTLSELGIVFLMFSLGLEFSLRKLREVGITALVAAALEILLMAWAGYELGRLFRWSQMDSVFLGAILSISSTTIIIKALEELGKTKEKFAELIFGILIVEDILAIVMIALLSGFATTGAFEGAAVVKTVVKLSAFLAVLLVAGLIAVPRLLDYVAKFKSREMLLVTVIGLCFGVSLLAVQLGYSVALGAFLIGAIIAEARQIVKIEALMQPVRDLFSAVFFVSIGLLIEPSLLIKYLGPILLITAVVVVGKVIACSCGVFIAGNDLRSSLRVGMGLAQIGEFSFIIASFGLSRGVTSDFLYPIAVAVSALTTLLTPYLIRYADGLVGWITHTAPKPLLNYFETYTQWVGRLAAGGQRNLARQLIQKWCWQIALNLILITAIFIAAVFGKEHGLAWWPTVPGGENGLRAALWLAAMILSLPMLIAIVRKWQALGMLIAETSVSRSAGGEKTDALRKVISSLIFIAGCVGLFLFMLLLSSATLPSWNVMIVLGLILIAATVLLRRAFIRLHASAQGALQETLSQAPVARHAEPPRALPAMLHDAALSTVQITETSPAVGRMIVELKVRSETGASIVGIERQGSNLLNPGPEDELLAGDCVLLLGHEPQLAAARALLLDPVGSATDAL